MDIDTRDNSMQRRSRRLWWWAAGSIACALTVPIVGAAGGAQAAPRPAPAAETVAATCTGAVYTVVSGDGWYLIASKNKVTVSALLAANGATLSTPLFPGQRLCVPTTTPGATTTTAPGATTTTVKPPATVTIAQFPVQGTCYFTDTFGAPRSGGRSHEGVDIIAKAGLYLYAVADGTLTKQYVDAPGSLAGNGWRLTRADGTYFFYAHLSGFAPGLKVGSTVKAGQILGYVGMTGNAGTPHLHFEVHPGGGSAVNPTPIVKAVDGCKVTTVPPQPGTTVPPSSTPPTSTPPTSAPASTTPTTAPPTTAPTTTAPPLSTPPASGPLWQFVAPVLAYDSSGTKLVPGRAVTVRLDSVAGVPATTPGVMLRVMARNVAGPGYLSVHTCAAGPNSTSTLMVQPNRLNVTMTLAKVTDGTLCVTSSVALDLRLYAVGYQAADGVGVQPMATKRALDTRSGAKLAANANTVLTPSRLGMPLGSKAVTLTVTVIAPAGAGAIGIGPCGGSPWIVNISADITQVFSAIVRANDAGVCVTSSVAVHLVVDVTAVWRTGSGTLPAVAPVRVFDSRPNGVTSTGKVLNAGTPAGAKRAQYTITLLAGSTSGSVFLWNCSAAKPTAAVSHAPAGTRTAVTVTVDVTGGGLCLATTAPMQVLVDLVAAA